MYSAGVFGLYIKWEYSIAVAKDASISNAEEALMYCISFKRLQVEKVE